MHELVEKTGTRCSTNVNQNGVHIGSGGYWGYCPVECIQGSRTTTTATTTSTITSRTTTITTTTAPTGTAINAIEATNIENFKLALNEIAEGNLYLNLTLIKWLNKFLNGQNKNAYLLHLI